MPSPDLTQIFKAYDIRGRVGDQLTPARVETIGRAVADYLPTRGSVAVGYDMRPDSHGLAEAFRTGLTAQGRHVLDLGQITSDMISFAVGTLHLAGGAMITASHNPGTDNGIKLYRDGARPVALASGLAAIRDAVIANHFQPVAPMVGTSQPRDMTKAWIDHCLSFVTTPLKPFQIAIDAGNGMAGKIVPHILPKLPCRVEELYFDLDGTFPNHEANPTKIENLQDLIDCVREKKLDFGIAFDGDGDRAGFVDDLGRPVLGSDLVTLVAKHVLTHQPGAEIIVEVRTSRATEEWIRAWGGRVTRTKAGRIDIGRVMRDHNAPFGGETTGHLFFKDNFFADSGLIGALVAMVALTESGQKLSTLIDSYRRYAMGPEMNFPVADPEAVLARLAGEYADGAQDRLDGLTVNYPDWWFNLRLSNTEPVVRLNLEANDIVLLEKKKAELLAIIKPGLTHFS